MASVPTQGKKGKKVSRMLNKLVTNYKKNFFRYSIFALIIVEGLSFWLQKYDNYTLFWYPLLTQIALFSLVYPMFSMSNVFKFCLRKKIAFGLLSLYYALGIFYLIVGGFSDDLYMKAQYLIYGGVAICLLLSIRKGC